MYDIGRVWTSAEWPGWGEGEKRRRGEGETGRLGDSGTGRLGDWEKASGEDRKAGRRQVQATAPLGPTIDNE